MSAGLLCDCPLPLMPGLSPNDYGHRTSPCPQYAEDQVNGGRCSFCADAERIGHAYRRHLGIGKGFGPTVRALSTPESPNPAGSGETSEP